MHRSLLPLLLGFVLLPAPLYATDLEIHKETVNQEVRVGDTFSFTITVENTSSTGGGPFDSPETTVLDDMPAGLLFISATSTRGSCEAVAGGDGLVDVVCDLGTLPAGSSATITIQVQALEAGTVRNTASVSGALFDPDEDNNSSFVDLLIEAIAPDIEKTAILEEWMRDDSSDDDYRTHIYTVTYKIRVRFNELEGLTLEDVLPAALKVEEWEIEHAFGATCSLSGETEARILACTLSGTNGHAVDLRGHASPELLGEICNTAVLSQHGAEIGRSTACVDIERRRIPYSAAAEKARELAVCTPGMPDCNEPLQTLTEEPLPAGAQLCDQNGEGCMTLEEPSYVTFWDFLPYALFAHRCDYAVIPAETDQEGTPEAEEYECNGLPPVTVTEDEEGNPVRMPVTNLPLISEPPPDLEGFPTIEIDNDPPAAAPRVCALLVTGYFQNQNEEASFQATRMAMQQYLMQMPLGPRLPAESVQTLDNPTYEQLDRKLADLTGQCDVLYFYYYGHGDPGGINLSNGAGGYAGTPYATLATDIYEVGAQESIVVLDNCNSGAAIPAFKADPHSKEQNITVMTSASTENLGYQAYNTNVPGVLVSAYTGGLVLSARSSRADADMDGTVSLKESHLWLRRVNPRNLRFRNAQGGVDTFGINEKQDPQLLENRVQPAEGTQGAFHFPEAGVVITVGSGKRAGIGAVAAIRVEQVVPRAGEPSQDADLIELADGRHRTIEVIESGAPEAFSLDITFRMDGQLDAFDGDGIPGLAYRADAGSAWAARDATVWNPADSTVTITGVTASGDWAFALTSGASAVAAEAAGLPATFTLYGNYPNPFNPATTITFDLAEPATVRVEVLDLLGRTVLVLPSQAVPAGASRILAVDASVLASGIYLYRLEAHGAHRTHTATGRMVLVR